MTFCIITLSITVLSIMILKTLSIIKISIRTLSSMILSILITLSIKTHIRMALSKVTPNIMTLHNKLTLSRTICFPFMLIVTSQ